MTSTDKLLLEKTKAYKSFMFDHIREHKLFHLRDALTDFELKLEGIDDE